MRRSSKRPRRTARQAAIVSGGASGIGEGIALALGERGTGVCIADMNTNRAREVAEKIRSQGGQCIVSKVDVRSPIQVRRSVRETLDQFDHIDFLINCAGWNEFRKPEEYSFDHWQKTLAINLTGTWNMCVAVADTMRARRSGKIVNIGSTAGILANPRQAPYCAAKHGIIGLTRALAIDMGPYQINVNCVCPATVETPLGLQSTTPAYRKQTIGRIPFGRLAKVSDVVNAVLFLLSPEADFISGVVLPVDGGLTCSLRVEFPE